MNKLYRIISNTIIFFVCFVAADAYSQKHTKSYKESFNVNDNTILEIDINRSDIVFETWKENEVFVEAIIEVKGVSKEEIAAYFKENPIDITGNSKKIKISTNCNNVWNSVAKNAVCNLNDLNIEIPDFPEMTISAPAPMPVFDYTMYKKEGEAYLKKWQQDFDKNFNEVYKKEIENFVKSVEVDKKMIADRQEKMIRIEEKMREAMKMQEIQEKNGLSPVFNEGAYEVKKVIKIKMPKALKIKMNVRHGNVKLAENTKNLDATLSYSKLQAFTIDGEKTIIVASYSPVTVQEWNYGKLQADYAEKVNLIEVKNLTLDTTSSNVTIGYLINRAFIKNKFGSLDVNSISNAFTDLNVSLYNAEFKCEVPSTPYSIAVSGSNSELKASSCINLNATKSIGNTTLHKGFHLNNNSGKSITINAEYSKIALD